MNCLNFQQHFTYLFRRFLLQCTHNRICCLGVVSMPLLVPSPSAFKVQLLLRGLAVKVHLLLRGQAVKVYSCCGCEVKLSRYG